MFRYIFHILLFNFFLFQVSAQDFNQKIPFDSSITKESFSNGLTYYFKKNANPNNKATVKVIVKAGSVMEEEDQLGLAHLLEHMLFNGTKSYPKKEFNEYFSSIGIELGADFNAYTGYETTTYIFEIPTNDIEKFNKGLNVIAEMMFNASLEESFIDKERKIVEEEWRRGLDKDDRIQKEFANVAYQNSLYAKRDPIGEIDVIRNFKPQRLKDFYHTWYQPQNMALVIVGDINEDQIKSSVQNNFAKQKAKNQDFKRPEIEIPNYGKSIFLLQSDEEETDSVFSIYTKQPTSFIRTIEEYKLRIILDFVESIVEKRIASIVDQKQSPVIMAGIASTAITSEEDYYVSVAKLQDQDLDQGVEILLTILETIKQNGFIEEELAHEKKLRLDYFLQSTKEEKTRETSSIVDELTRNFLAEEFISGVDQEYEINKLILPTITVADLNKAYDLWFNDQDRMIRYIVPDQLKDQVNEQTFYEIEKRVRSKTYPQYTSLIRDEPLIKTPLKGGSIVKEQYYQDLDVTELDLNNGIKVFLKPVAFESQSLSFYAKSFGGYSHIANDQVAVADLFLDVTSISNVGSFSPTELSNKVDPSAVNVELTAEGYYEGMIGTAATANIKELFELIYLKLTSVEYTEQALAKIKSEVIDEIKKKQLTPRTLFSEQVVNALYKNHKRMKPVTEQQVKKIKLKDIQKFYNDRFGDPSDFVFTFVGDFKLETIKPYLAKYLGSLPGNHRKESYVDNNIRYEDNMKKIVVRKNTEPKSSSYRIYTNPFTNNLTNRFKLYIFDYVLERMLFQNIREEQGLVYSINVSLNNRHVPISAYSLFIFFQSDPNNNEKITKSIDSTIKQIAEGKIDPALFSEAKLKHTNDANENLRRNSFIQSAITDYYLDKEPINNLNRLLSSVEQVTLEDITTIAQEIMKDNYLEATLLPKP